LRSGCQRLPGATCPSQISPTTTRVEAIEYYHPVFDHYFVTASAADIDALDSGRLPGSRRTDEAPEPRRIANTTTKARPCAASTKSGNFARTAAHSSGDAEKPLETLEQRGRRMRPPALAAGELIPL
jgi:hypothetical protein